MYITKFALKNIARSKGRSFLIGIIVVIIAFAVCISLCIRQGAENAKNEYLKDLTITAQISLDRDDFIFKVMENKLTGEGDAEDLDALMGEELTLDELKVYAKAESVQSFYYKLTAYANGTDQFKSYGGSASGGSSNFLRDVEGTAGDGDFIITGFSSDEAMTEFVDGTCEVVKGAVFDEGTTDRVCVIPEELAEYNGLKVGNELSVSSPSDRSETHTIKIVGIYSNSQATAQAAEMKGFGGAMGDPANKIYMSYNALKNMVDSSETMEGTLAGTYVMGTIEAYESFREEVKAMGLPDNYVVSSGDVGSYEKMAAPLESLTKFTGYFLLVVLIVGAVILVVINIFATRERKYEIGVLTAIGMKKKKVVKLFVTEILIITLAGVVIGGGIGAAAAVPVGDTMASMVTQQTRGDDGFGGFGREFNDSSEVIKPNTGGLVEDANSPEVQFDDFFRSGMQEITTDISASVDLTVLLEMMGICILLALIAGMVSVVAIMRYEPLQILSNRD